MKKLMMAGMALMFTTGMLFAQSPVRQTVKIEEDQVPLAVRSAFEKDFNTVADNGYWTVLVETTQAGARTAAKPLWYTYNSGKKKEKVEIQFSPDGQLNSAKGTNSGTVSDSKEKKKIG